MPNLTSQMEAVCRRFEELSVRLNQPETAADPAQFRRLMQEYHRLCLVVLLHRRKPCWKGKNPLMRTLKL